MLSSYRLIENEISSLIGSKKSRSLPYLPTRAVLGVLIALNNWLDVEARILDTEFKNADTML